MATTHKLYTGAIYAALMGKVTDISAVGTSIKCCLLDDGYTFDQNVHVSYNDISADEISSAAPNVGYTTGGVALTSKTLTAADKTITFDSVDPSWATATFSYQYAVFYDDTPAADTDKMLLSVLDFGELKSVTAATCQIVLPTSGIFTVTVA